MLEDTSQKEYDSHQIYPIILTNHQVILSVHPWVIHRNPDIFGADCETYNPDRWLQGDTKKMDYFLIHVRPSIVQLLTSL